MPNLADLARMYQQQPSLGLGNVNRGPTMGNRGMPPPQMPMYNTPERRIGMDVGFPAEQQPGAIPPPGGLSGPQEMPPDRADIGRFEPGMGGLGGTSRDIASRIGRGAPPPMMGGGGMRPGMTGDGGQQQQGLMQLLQQLLRGGGAGGRGMGG